MTRQEEVLIQQSAMLEQQEALMRKVGEYVDQAMDALHKAEREHNMPKEDEAPDPKIEQERKVRERQYFIRVFAAHAIGRMPSEMMVGNSVKLLCDTATRIAVAQWNSLDRYFESEGEQVASKVRESTR